MEPEVTVICVDNSALLNPMVGGCGLDNAQTEAIALYYEEKLKAHPDNEVGLVAMGLLKSTGFVTPTRDLHRICYAVKALLYYGLSCIPIASALFYFNSSNLPKGRLLVFCGGRLSMDSDQLKRCATKFKESDVAVDVVNFGVQRWPMTKKQLLQAFVADADNNGNSRYLYAPIGSSTSLAHQILSSPLAPGVPTQKKKKVVSDKRILNKLVNICITTYLGQQILNSPLAPGGLPMQEEKKREQEVKKMEKFILKIIKLLDYPYMTTTRSSPDKEIIVHRMSVLVDYFMMSTSPDKESAILNMKELFASYMTTNVSSEERKKKKKEKAILKMKTKEKAILKHREYLASIF